MTESVTSPIEATAQPKNDGLWHAETMVAADTKPGKSLADRLRALRSRVSSPPVASPETYGQAPNSRPDKIKQEDGTVVERNRLAIDRTPTPLDEKIAAAVAPVVMTKDGRAVDGADLYGPAPTLGKDVVTGIDPFTGKVTSSRNVLVGDTLPTGLEKAVAGAVDSARDYVTKNVVEPAKAGTTVLPEGAKLYGNAPATGETINDDGTKRNRMEAPDIQETAVDRYINANIKPSVPRGPAPAEGGVGPELTGKDLYGESPKNKNIKDVDPKTQKEYERHELVAAKGYGLMRRFWDKAKQLKQQFDSIPELKQELSEARQKLQELTQPGSP